MTSNHSNQIASPAIWAKKIEKDCSLGLQWTRYTAQIYQQIVNSNKGQSFRFKVLAEFASQKKVD